MLDAPTLLMLACVGALCLASCWLTIRALVFNPRDRAVLRSAGVAAACFAASIIGCLALSDAFGSEAAAACSVTIFAAAAVLLAAVNRTRRQASPETELTSGNAGVAPTDGPYPCTPQLDDTALRAHMARAYDLTRREEEILGLLLDGRAQADLPTELCIAENTVKTHVRHIYRKLNVRSRDELFQKAESFRMSHLARATSGTNER